MPTIKENITRWHFPVGARARAGAMWAPIAFFCLRQPIGGIGIASVPDKQPLACRFGQKSRRLPAAAKLLARDEARRIAANIAKLPS